MLDYLVVYADLSVVKVRKTSLGLYTYEGHIFSTTHATTFGFGSDVDPGAVALTFGESMGAYLVSLIDLLRPQIITPIAPPALSKEIEMRDIKYEALYQRGPLGDIRMGYAAGLTLLLSSLNYAQYILRRVLAAKGLALFRLKFLTAYHADSSMRTVQDRIMGSERPSEETQQVFQLALGNADSRWLRKKRSLRNLLTHYTAKESCAEILDSNATRVEAIEYLSGDLKYDEIDDLLDRHIEHLSDTLEKGFQLSGDPFWYGKVT
jgi:hypothetical protein